MSSDLSYALTYISNEEKRQRYAQRIDQLSQVVEQSANAVSLIDINGKIRYINAGFSKLTGYRADEILGKPTNVLAVNEQQLDAYTQICTHLQTHQEWRGELEHRGKHGNTYWSKHVISQIKDSNDNMTHYVDTAEDSSDLHLAQNEIQQLAFYDSLTSLPNRRLLQDRLTQALARARRQQQIVALLYINLSPSNDDYQTLSSEEKDVLLKENADRINSSIREMDSVVRLSSDNSGDTFAALLTDLSDFTAATRAAKEIISSLSPDILLSSNPLQITTNIGISLFPQDGDTLEQLLKNANTAMHHAKANRINHFRFYAHRMNNTQQTLPERQEHLHEASKNKNITRDTETH
jgi:diguanylate cyclase (GGDEF)-like protein/PAS domain S-box-containing protein